ncbi:MAG: DUF3859 domain-containing protein [Hyphomonadaceae bacterium]
MRVLLFVLFAVFAPAPAWAQQAERAEILEFGTYEAQELSSAIGVDGLAYAETTQFRWLQRAQTIPGAPGVGFGFRYRLDGAPAGAHVALRKVVIFPAPGLKPPGKPAVMRSERVIDATIGETSDTGWRFDEPFEIAPGGWTFQLWQGDRLLIEKKFTVVLGVPIS